MVVAQIWLVLESKEGMMNGRHFRLCYPAWLPFSHSPSCQNVALAGKSEHGRILFVSIAWLARSVIEIGQVACLLELYMKLDEVQNFQCVDVSFGCAFCSQARTRTDTHYGRTKMQTIFEAETGQNIKDGQCTVFGEAQ